MPEPPRHPWDQQEGEPAPAYERFCLYRDAGSDRALDVVYRAYCLEHRGEVPPSATQAPGRWRKDSIRWQWVKRVQAWDEYMSALRNRCTVVRFCEAIEVYAGKVLTAARRLEGPSDWKQLTESLSALSNFIAPEAQDALDQSPDDGPSGEPTTDVAGSDAPAPQRLPDQPPGVRNGNSGGEADGGSGEGAAPSA
jgi:hypothetical protein